jgi:hypothetical protein
MAPTTTSNANPPSKSDFIRSQSVAMSAAEIVEKAKAGGIDLRPGLVYEVRRIAKAKKGAAAKKRMTAAKATAPEVRSTPSKSASAKKPMASKPAAKKTASKPIEPSASASTNEEQVLKMVAADVGLGRAIEILLAERARVHSIFMR